MTATFLACASAPSSPPVPPAPQPEAPVVDEAPWQGEAIRLTAVAQPYITAWNAAENRGSCALLAFSDTDAVRGASPRVATFAGGWGVAWDMPDLRSAYGIAGTGANASDPSYHEWPHTRSWSDGSSAGYGPEGGTGPNQLAYLTIPGQQCLYNVWSRLGREHLEQLLEAIRFVDAGGGSMR